MGCRRERQNILRRPRPLTPCCDRFAPRHLISRAVNSQGLAVNGAILDGYESIRPSLTRKAMRPRLLVFTNPKDPELRGELRDSG